ncbi:hypothetical protein NW755_014174 [Fusarium falciforme]|uniref:Rhodopsin domain-containing protein n=1 Tax=Fusarium falciforme TaxID=195108 RepID=A0A9W8UUJ7_9HYPO|nr:hypothetical protein NW755_014174 [Fusarium falciforme]
MLETVAAYLVGAKFDGLTNSYMTDEERAELDPDSREYVNRVWGSKIQVIGWSFYASILWTLKLLWGVNISLRQRLTLMLLFSGAIFTMMASTIRAVVILNSGPNGPVTGSSWACRETFVAIIVTNMPVIHPLLRKGASMIGLSVIFTGQTNTAADSHQLRSIELGRSRFDTNRNRGAQHRHPLSVPQVTTWGSDEHILPEDTNSKSSGPNVGGGGIVVA